MRRTRTFLVAATALLAALFPLAAGGAPALAAPLTAPPAGPAATTPGTVVQRGGALVVPAGEEGPVTTRLTVTLPPGTEGPLQATRLSFEAPHGDPGSRPGPRITSTCSVNGGAYAPCPWDSPDPETDPGPVPVAWLVFDLPPAPVPAGSSTVTYDITVDAPSELHALGEISTTVELRDTTGVVAASGPLVFRFAAGTPEAWLRSSLHARDRAGVLWQYDATGKGGTLLKGRKRVGGGWNAYTALTKLDRTTAAGGGSMVARDRAGVLWYYRGSGRESTPFRERVRVGGGWNVYTALVGVPGGDLFARDRAGVLWRYEGTGLATRPFGHPIRIGGGWNAYASIVSFGDGLVAHTPAGRQWRYEKADGRDPAVPFAPRREVGGGWNAFTALAGTGLVHAYDASLAARTRDGRLLLYGVVRWNGNSAPASPRPAGWGFDIYDMLL